MPSCMSSCSRQVLPGACPSGVGPRTATRLPNSSNASTPAHAGCPVRIVMRFSRQSLGVPLFDRISCAFHAPPSGLAPARLGCGAALQAGSRRLDTRNARVCSRVQPSSSASATSQPCGFVPGAGIFTMRTRHPSATSTSATASAAFTPGCCDSGSTWSAASRCASQSGQITTLRPASGLKSAFETALPPPGQVSTSSDSPTSSCAASAHFSPSTISTG